MARIVVPVRVLEGGRIVIPSRFRRELGISTGDTLSMELEDGELRLATRRQSLARAKELLRPFLGGPSMADELIAERRAEAND
ncbi:MAG: AbrB/MazE/SpoVT family DNA-binding domain-containing protein [Dehalococcoidia bacterium]